MALADLMSRHMTNNVLSTSKFATSNALVITTDAGASTIDALLGPERRVLQRDSNVGDVAVYSRTATVATTDVPSDINTVQSVTAGGVSGYWIDSRNSVSGVATELTLKRMPIAEMHGSATYGD